MKHNKLFTISLISAASIGLLAFTIPNIVLAATTVGNCSNALDATQPVANNYGAAFNLFSTEKELIVKGTQCSGGNATVEVGSGKPEQYIYRSGYRWSGSQWQVINFSGSSAINNDWFSRSATASAPLNAGSATYVAGYVCTWSGNTWRCGCRDTACSSPSWQLQGVTATTGTNPNPTNSATPAPGGNGGGQIPANLPTVNGPCPQFKTGVVTFRPKGAPANEAQLYVGPNPGNGPLVFYFHGTGESSGFSKNGPRWLGQSVIDEIMAQGGVAIVPKGHGGYEWIIADGDTDESDLFLIDEMVACAIQEAKIDPRRIHATGLSSGATLTSDMVHRRSNYLASGAPQSGGFDPYNPIPKNQNPNNKMAVMIIHGGPSDTWPSNQCETYEPQSIIMANLLLQEGSFPILCNQGGGHRNIPDRNAVWEFFKAHPYNVNPKPWTNGAPSGFPSYCEIYRGGKTAKMPSSCAY